MPVVDAQQRSQRHNRHEERRHCLKVQRMPALQSLTSLHQSCLYRLRCRAHTIGMQARSRTHAPANTRFSLPPETTPPPSALTSSSPRPLGWASCPCRVVSGERVVYVLCGACVEEERRRSDEWVSQTASDWSKQTASFCQQQGLQSTNFLTLPANPGLVLAHTMRGQSFVFFVSRMVMTIASHRSLANCGPMFLTRRASRLE